MDKVGLINNDCLEELRNMEDDSVDVSITSPPYNLNKKHSGGHGSKQSYDGWYPDDMPELEYQAWQKEVITQLLRVTKGSVFYNHRIRYAWHSRNKYRTPSNIYHPLDWLSDFPIWAEIIWNRMGKTGHGNNRVGMGHEVIYQLGRPNKFHDMGYTSVWSINPTPNKGHVCTFPEEIPIRCILMSTDPGDIVLDPFMGVGTTCIAARKTNRKYIGIEIDTDYFRIAEKRLSDGIQMSILT